MRLPGTTVAEKLSLNYAVDGECWRWTGAHNPKGYGRIVTGNRMHAVHRVAYELVHGPIADGMEIDHVREWGCQWRDCINPAHLEAVTHRENLMRMFNARTHCAAGHPRTPENIKIVIRRGIPIRTCRPCRTASRRKAGWRW